LAWQNIIIFLRKAKAVIVFQTWTIMQKFLDLYSHKKHCMPCLGCQNSIALSNKFRLDHFLLLRNTNQQTASCLATKYQLTGNTRFGSRFSCDA